MTTAICIASGASLTHEDVEYCQGKGKIYAVKECWNLAPWADILYAADGDWWDTYKGVPDFKGEKWTVDSAAAKKYNLNLIKYKPQEIWSTDPEWIATGGNSGFQVLNMAVLNGATKVILLGYDMGFTTQKHWWTGQYKREIRGSNYKDWIMRFNRAAPLIDAKVWNCTRKTALQCFRKAELRDVI